MLCIVILFFISSFCQSAPLTSNAAKRPQKNLPWHKWVCGCLSAPDHRSSARCHRLRWTLCTGDDDTPCKVEVVIKNIPRSDCSDSEIITSWSSPEGKVYMQVLNYLTGKNTLKITKLLFSNGTRELLDKSVLEMSQEWVLRAEKPRRKGTTTRLTTTIAGASTSSNVFRTNATVRITTAQNKLHQSTKPSTTTASQSTAYSSDSYRAAKLYPLGCGHREAFIFRIYRGSPASEYAWPWHVALTTDMDKTCRPKSENKDTFCGGTLIHPWFVLTAAHCVSHKNFMVVAGDYDRTDCREREVYASVANISPYHLNHDVALIQLSNPIHSNSNGIGYACLPPPRFALPAGTKCMIYGWGKTTETARRGSNVIVEAELELGHADSCLPAANETHVCAGMLGDLNTDSCYGDSGGGLMCELNADRADMNIESEYDEESEEYDNEVDEEESRWVLYGVTSRGRGCGREPAIYELVPAYHEWIMKTISDFEERNAPHRRRGT